MKELKDHYKITQPELNWLEEYAKNHDKDETYLFIKNYKRYLDAVRLQKAGEEEKAMEQLHKLIYWMIPTPKKLDYLNRRRSPFGFDKMLAYSDYYDWQANENGGEGL